MSRARIRAAGRLAGAGALTFLGLLLVPSHAYADTSGGTTGTTTGTTTGSTTATATGNQNTYSLTAEGDGMLFKVVNAQLPASTTEEVSPYSSEAANDSSGNSSAFAGLPYPGPVGATIEGTVNGLSGGATPPLPPAPGFVTVTYPGSPSANESQGPYVVKADTAQYQATAQAGFGVSPQAGSTTAHQQVFSTADVVANPDGSVSSTASAGVDALNVGILDALNVSSTATITETGSGSPSIKTTTNLGTFQVLGFTVGITANGFTLAGANLPLPVASILKEVNSVLGKNGIQISVLPETESTDPNTGATSVTSSSVEVVTVQNVPALGPTTVTYDFGRVTVSAADVGTGGSSSSSAASGTDSGSSTSASDSGSSSTAAGSSSTPVDTSGATVDNSTSPALAADAGSAGSSLSSGTDGSTALAPSIAGPTGSSAGSSPTGSSSATGSGPALPTTLGYVPTVAKVGTSLSGVYLLVVLGGLAAAAAAFLFRQLGIRLALR